jgi:hypothetical protein
MFWRACVPCVKLLAWSKPLALVVGRKKASCGVHECGHHAGATEAQATVGANGVASAEYAGVASRGCSGSRSRACGRHDDVAAVQDLLL